MGWLFLVFADVAGNLGKTQIGSFDVHVGVQMLRERVKVGDKGRIVLPKPIRQALGIKNDSILEVYLYNGKIVMEVLVL